MCLSSPKAPPPPPPPPPPAPPAPVPELKTGADANANKDPALAQNKGRRKLRIDMTSGTTASEGTGLNIPTA
jgi:hypothetical protein